MRHEKVSLPPRRCPDDALPGLRARAGRRGCKPRRRHPDRRHGRRSLRPGFLDVQRHERLDAGQHPASRAHRVRRRCQQGALRAGKLRVQRGSDRLDRQDSRRPLLARRREVHRGRPCVHRELLRHAHRQFRLRLLQHGEGSRRARRAHRSIYPKRADGQLHDQHGLLGRHHAGASDEGYRGSEQRRYPHRRLWPLQAHRLFKGRILQL